MKAVIATQYGAPEVLQLQEVAKPVPQAKQILVKVHATTVTAGDSRVRSFTVPRSFWLPARLTLGLTKPKKAILGMVIAGTVEAVGSAVTRFQPGDQVYAYDITRLNAYAEYACVSEDQAVTLKPANVSFEEAAALPFGAVTALHFLKRGNIRRGQRVLIYGASGSVGTAAVQIAKHFGADVTAVCSTGNIELVRSLGADRVIDYTKEDFATLGITYDIIFDTVGTSSLAASERVLNDGGVYLQAVAGPAELIQMKLAARRTGKTFIGETAYPSTEALVDLKDLIEAGKLKPVIDRCYPLEQIVEAHRYVDQGHKKGNVVITVGQPSRG
ncbi:MAG: NAD(P)-dependent alcohol dehydrogenase [Chloroflexi bacterium]|uniref:NAD(P)-dependent alcohol dehydrogenase n=1 Tax=Candidatus Flexifilum breve TaxID=3140694 RepID=UPI0031358DD9|nr:NAD(P)-dependent alcohol dehydrogenase [Chloroflexota bacterium]